MNYYNPYYVMAPISMARPGLFSSIRNGLGAINFNSILNGTQRTLNIVNQAIPLVKQVSPVVKNAKTMFRVMNEFKKSTNNVQKTYINNENNISNAYESGPRFFA